MPYDKNMRDELDLVAQTGYTSSAAEGPRCHRGDMSVGRDRPRPIAKACLAFFRAR